MVYTEAEFVFTPLEPIRDIFIFQLGELEYESMIETDTGLKAYIDSSLYSPKSLDTLLADYPDFSISYTAKEIKEQNWNAEWEKNFEPIVIGDKCVIRAPFHESVSNVEHEIVISPKMSFGTGHHETTFQMVEQLSEMDLEGKSVCDMGTGTGVLAIYAEKRGATDLIGIDIEDWAYENALENSTLNNSKKVDWKLGDVAMLPADRKYDVFLANINKNILLKDIPTYVEHISAGGFMVLSGFFTTDVDDLIAKATENGLVFVKERKRNSWSVLVFKNK